MRARSLCAHGCALSEPPEPLAKFAGHGCPANRGREGVFFFGYFLLGKQKKVTRPPGWRTKKHRDVSRSSRKRQSLAKNKSKAKAKWIPAFAGMTKKKNGEEESTGSPPSPETTIRQSRPNKPSES